MEIYELLPKIKKSQNYKYSIAINEIHTPCITDP
jgi:hypothetical protein